MNPVLISEDEELDGLPTEAPTAAKVPSHVTRRLLGSTSALGASVAVERGAGFLANILAARLGGASTFGAYSLAITTANNISTYAAGGIGSTAARFSGKYPAGTPGYKTLGRALFIVSLISALIAAAGLWLGAAPIAHLLGRDQLTNLLRWSALSAAGFILLECMRGFLLGHGRHAGMLLLSVAVGIGMITFIPIGALKQSPTRMIVSQGCITTCAVLLCVLLASPLGLIERDGTRSGSLGPMLREVWGFGFVQLAGLIGLNLAGWWMTSLVARASLVQMSFLAIASQMRNMVALAPTMLTESSYAVMADREGEDSQTPNQVMALCTFASIYGSLLFAAVGLIVLPWALHLMYGHAYDAAAIATAIALAVAVIHMSAGPASARLTIVSIRSTGVINTVWAITVAIASTAFLMRNGTAGRAMVVYLVAHLLSAVLVILMLSSRDHLPKGMTSVFWIGSVAGMALAGLSVIRTIHPEHALPLTAGMVVLATTSLMLISKIGKRYHWLPGTQRIVSLLRSPLRITRKIFAGHVS